MRLFNETQGFHRGARERGGVADCGASPAEKVADHWIHWHHPLFLGPLDRYLLGAPAPAWPKALGLTIPETLLATADEVIQ